MQIFLLKPLADDHAILEAEEARHCLKVLRHRIGDQIHCVDGKGYKYLAEITQVDRREAKLRILEKTEAWGEHSFHLHLAVSPLRLRDRSEWLVEKSVELGVTEISLIECQHTVLHHQLKTERLRKTMLSALKQCKRSHLPELNAPVLFSSWLENEFPGEKFIAQADAATPFDHFTDKISQASNFTVIIGPEGDFTPNEMQVAREAGFLPVQLGKQRLRTETAAIHFLSILKYLKGY